MKNLMNILRDTRIAIPLGFLLGLELFLQTGLYKSLMQPRSYADNVNRILRMAGQDKDPQALILGTSVAYQGIQVPELNELLRKEAITVESGACEGAKLETQHLIMRALLDRMPHVKTVIHVVEASHPGTARFHQDQANRSMAAQFPRVEALHVLKSHNLKLEPSDYVYFFVRSITYQKDMRDFVLDPLDRFKGIGRRFREKPTGYIYENKYEYKLSAFPAKNPIECVEVATRANIEQMGKEVTDQHHRNAVVRTCQIVLMDPLAGSGNAQWTALFFQRLKVMYKDITDRGIKIIVVFSPYSDVIKDLNAEYRISEWQNGLAAITARENYTTVDLRKSLDGPKNGDYYYDTIHLNREGATVFTKALADAIRPILLKNTAR